MAASHWLVLKFHNFTKLMKTKINYTVSSNLALEMDSKKNRRQK
jgi:hypothetical protein